MIRGGKFFAVWNEKSGLWDTDETAVADIVDDMLYDVQRQVSPGYMYPPMVLSMKEYNSKSWKTYRTYVSSLPDMYSPLDTKLTFLNDPVAKQDHVSKRLPYDLIPGDYSAWDKIIGTLYDPEEREKIEWAIGSIVSGDSKDIQKFVVLYGDAGTGKSTILNIIAKLFQGYCASFDARSLASAGNVFSMESFRDNPLVAIQHDGDLSFIEDNTKLNSIVSHESMEMHEKFKSAYFVRLNSFLFMGTNKPVRITDSKSGIIRRLIDVAPSGRLIPAGEYQVLMNRIDFELGAIALHCLEVYQTLGKHYYDTYKPFEMISNTDVFFNFVNDNYLTFKSQEYTQLKQAWDMYKSYCEEAAIPYKLPMYKFKFELKNYFEDFKDYIRENGKMMRSVYIGFKESKIHDMNPSNKTQKEPPPSLSLDETVSVLDDILEDCPAQYATQNDTPMMKWDNVTTKLKDLDTTKTHYVLPQSSNPNHIVIDFDLKNEKGEKDATKNLEAASKWPPTYAEFSKGGKGIHLHYIYDGDISTLSRVYDEGIEVKVFSGNSSLRRRLTKCNNLPVAHISAGLPLKEDKATINYNVVKSERMIREMIEKNLRKEYHAYTAPSVSFIYKILEDAYNEGVVYDVTDMRPRVLAFANNSHNQAAFCVGLVAKMKFKSEVEAENKEDESDSPLVFFDCEVFPNLFLINWKYAGEDMNCVRMINPTPQEVGALFKYKLVGFNNRRYDNHILYARYLGYDNQKLYMLSQRLVSSNSQNAMFREAYNISYTDIYDFASAANKKSLKKFEVELHIHHKELGLPWDEEVPEEKWEEVAEYCDNDVISTEKVFYHLKGDWVARQILAKLSGLTVNDTTNQHSTKIIFGNDRTPQGEFCYRDMSLPVKDLDDEVKEFIRENTPIADFEFVSSADDQNEKSLLPYFPGYTFVNGKSMYRGFEAGEGGFVYAEPGIYWNVALLDIASMHPSSIEAECLFGPKYTKKFSEIKQSRVHIKHKDRELLETILGGALKEFLTMIDNGELTYKELSNAMKTVINSVYGLTSASFDNPFRDKRNKDNIVAKRGALFMIDLLYEVQKKGFTVAHIKTDSIKIPNATKEIIDFVMEFGKKYGYTFEHEATYSKMCLINDSVYIAQYADGDDAGKWTPTGARFAHPYVFKTIFSKEPIDFYDLCEIKNVNTGSIYLDFNENLPDVVALEKEKDKAIKKGAGKDILDDLDSKIAEGHNYVFVGRTGLFCPIAPGYGGGELVRLSNGKYSSVTGATGYRWAESEVVQATEKANHIDMRYFRGLVDDALDQIRKFGDAEVFLNESDISVPPWCDVKDCATCEHKDSCDSLSAVMA